MRDLLTRLRSLRTGLRTDPEGSGLTLITIALVGMAVAISYIVFAPKSTPGQHPQADATRTGVASAAPLSPAVPVPSALPTAQPSAQPSAQPPVGPTSRPRTEPTSDATTGPRPTTTSAARPTATSAARPTGHAPTTKPTAGKETTRATPPPTKQPDPPTSAPPTKQPDPPTSAPPAPQQTCLVEVSLGHLVDVCV